MQMRHKSKRISVIILLLICVISYIKIPVLAETLSYEVYDIHKYSDDIAEFNVMYNYDEYHFLYNYVENDLISDRSNTINVIEIVNPELNDNVLTFEFNAPVYSVPITCSVDLDCEIDGTYDSIEEYKVYPDGYISFDTSRGPLYSIDYVNERIAECSSSGNDLYNVSINGNELKITVRSEELKVKKTYSFDLTKNVQSSNFTPVLGPVPSPFPDFDPIIDQGEKPENTRADEPIVTSGKCGEKTTWKLVSNGDDTYTLVISGTGKTSDYEENSYDVLPPWDHSLIIPPEHRGDSSYEIYAENNSHITKVVVEQGVTAIGSYAFRNLASVTDFKIADSVTRIGNGAFINCKSLKNITLPGNVDIIEGDSFNICYNLEEVHLQEGTKSIQIAAFCWCDNLTKIYLPSTLREIYPSAFVGAGLKEIYYNGTLAQWENVAVYEEFNNVKVICLDSEKIYNIKTDVFCRKDIIQYIIYDGYCLTFDTSRGPQVRILTEDVSLDESSSPDTVIFNSSRKGNVISFTIKSAENPEEISYVFDLDNLFDSCYSHNTANLTIEEGIVFVNHSDSTITWAGNNGPYYVVDYVEGKLIDCSVSAQLLGIEKKGDIVSIDVISTQLPVKTRYVFSLADDSLISASCDIREEEVEAPVSSFLKHLNNIYEILVAINDDVLVFKYDANSKNYWIENNIIGTYKIENLTFTDDSIIINFKALNHYGNIKAIANLSKVIEETDTVEWYKVYPDGHIEFDSCLGPLYSIDYVNNKIIGCSSSGAKLISCKVEDNTLYVVVYSNELALKYEYSFNLSQNVQEGNEEDCMDGVGEFSEADKVEYFNILLSDNAIEWDSIYGPYYRISLEDGKVLECTSDWLFPDKPVAQVLFYERRDNKITVTVYSAELPYAMTYIFDTSVNECVGSVSDYDDEAAQNEAEAIIDSIVNDSYAGNGVDEETINKIKLAKKANKLIKTIIESNSVSEKKVENAAKQLISEVIKNNKLECEQYFDINFSIYADSERLGNITELGQEIEFEIAVEDEDFDDKDYFVIRIHGDEITVLEGTKVGKKIKFTTDRFSTYVLASQKNNSAPEAGDSMVGIIALIGLLISLGAWGLALSIRTK